MRLSAAMLLSLAVASGTQLLPGTRVRFKDPEAPRPPSKRIKGTVIDLSLAFDGECLELFGVTVRWDGLLPDEDDSFCIDELAPLEIIR